MLSDASDSSAQDGKLLSETSYLSAHFRNMPSGVSDGFTQVGNMLSEVSDASAHTGKASSEVFDSSAQVGNTPSETSDASAQACAGKSHHQKTTAAYAVAEQYDKGDSV